MKVLLIRHGQSTNNKAAETHGGETGRVSDPGLTDLGTRQAEALAGWLTSVNLVPTRLCASLMRRTIQTAAPLSDRFGLPIEVREDLFEAGGPYQGPFGQAVADPGSPRSELQGLARQVLLPDSATEQGWWTNPVETPADVLRRAESVAGWLAAQDDELLAVVAHGAFLSMLVTALLNPTEISLAQREPDVGADDLPVWFTFDNTSTTLVSIGSDDSAPVDSLLGACRNRVEWINRIDHLQHLADHEPSQSSNPFPPSQRRLAELGGALSFTRKPHPAGSNLRPFAVHHRPTPE